MNVVPLRKPGKPFAWSYSKLKDFETCPRQYHEVKVLKNFKEIESEHQSWGKNVHDALANRLSKKVTLPVTMSRYEEECAELESAAAGGVLRTELKLAFDKDFRACGYFDQGTWFRGIADVLILRPPIAMAFDWKTGKPLEDMPQLALMAQCVFANHPDVDIVGTEFIWLGDPVSYTRENFHRKDMMRVWNNLWPRLQLLLQAHETGVFPPKESGLCKKHCIVETCRYNGRFK